ncbi:MAG: UDP-galactopyranose mutase [Acidobacteriaceae bacterium]
MKPYILVVGAGFAGAVCAREMADAGHQVLIVDRRDHIAGNAFDEHDIHGVLIHRYGPHLFHANSEQVFTWLSRFTNWHRYEHRVLAQVDGKLYPIPINRTTINRLYGLNLDEAGVAEYLSSVRIPCGSPRTSEEVVLNSVGHDLCEKFFRGYTRKQWGLDLCDLSAGVAARIPTRTNDDDRYFSDTYQAMPQEGYTAAFRRILDHPNIKITLNTDYADIKNEVRPFHTVYTGPVDAYFDYQYGRLPYRSLRFEHKHLPNMQQFQPVGTVNYPNEQEYTRITEFKHVTGQQHPGTSIVREYPQAEGDPYYPIPRPENEAKYQQYKALADKQANVTFVGRLAKYRYFNMDQVVASALKITAGIFQK